MQKRSTDPDVHCTALLLTYRGSRRPLAHYQWVSWPDRFVPNQLTVPYTLLSSARARKTPTVIHCSAGIGRTGTLVVLELLCRYIFYAFISENFWESKKKRVKIIMASLEILLNLN